MGVGKSIILLCILLHGSVFSTIIETYPISDDNLSYPSETPPDINVDFMQHTADGKKMYSYTPGTDSESTYTSTTDAEPMYSSEAEPMYSSEAEPKYSSDAEPKYSSDAEPKYSSDAEPKYSSDAEPKYSSDAEPKYSSDAEPKYNSDAEPKYSSDAESKYSTTTNTVSMYNTTTAPLDTHDVSGLMIQKIFLWNKNYGGGSSYQLLELNNPANLSSSTFIKYTKTYILVHGFLGDGLEPWIISIKDKLLKLSTCNIISVQWPSGSAYFVIDYYHVVSHVPVVGGEIARLLYQLDQAKGVTNTLVHIIGHSLGAHIAGFVGKNMDSTIARISGLDPAGLTYHGSPASERLDKTDAVYVDVLHTNGCRNYLVWTDCFGIDIPIGHTDYWPNGGRHQPPCRNKPHNISSWSIGCDHMMSHTYYLESLDYSPSSTKFLARPCEDYVQYKLGNCTCGSVPQYMGFLSNARAEGNFYLNTSLSPPYALPDRDCPPGTWLVGITAVSEISALVIIGLLLLLAAVISACALCHDACCSGTGDTGCFHHHDKIDGSRGNNCCIISTCGGLDGTEPLLIDSSIGHLAESSTSSSSDNGATSEKTMFSCGQSKLLTSVTSSDCDDKDDNFSCITSERNIVKL